MYPNRLPASMQSNTSQPNTKDIINDLCERIKREYTNMYAHIQNLKSELEKATSQRADYERYYSLNQDMTFAFNAEIHKMMDVIKRLVSACIQQVPFLPLELQQSCMMMIEQVKQYTSTELQNIIMTPGQPPPPQPGHHLGPPSQHGMQHHMTPPPHGVVPPMMPPGMHASPHMPPPMPHMIPFPNRLQPLGGGGAPMCVSDSRDHSNNPNNMPHDIPRHFYNKERECYSNMQNPENCNGMHPKDRMRHSSAGNKYGGIASSSSAISTSVSAQFSTNHRQHHSDHAPPHCKSPRDQHENDTCSEKCDYSSDPPGTKEPAAESSNASDESSSSKSGTPAVSSSRKNIDSTEYTPNKGNVNSPQNKTSKDRPPMPSTLSSRHNANVNPCEVNSHYYNMAVRSGPSGPHLSSELPPPPQYPPVNLPPPYMRPNHIPSYDPMLMLRNNAPGGGSYCPMPTYQMPGCPPPMSYPHYQSEYADSTFASGNGSNSGLPRSFNMLTSLQHGDVVCAVTFSNPYKYVFTGSKGSVKIWDINEITTPKLLTSLDCLKDNYVRACKSINDNKILIVSGEYSSIGIWNLTQSNGSLSAAVVSELTNPAPVCYDMAVSNDEKSCYCCCSNGSIVGWDIETQRVVRSFTGHVDGATCIDLAADGNTMWTGGLDATARCWDSREGKQVHSLAFPTQVFALSIAPTSEYIVVGLENKTIEMCLIKHETAHFGERSIFRVHESCVLTVKLSNSGKWLVSSSKDNYTNCVKMPQGIPLFMTREGSSILSTDISPDDKYVISGGGEKKASIYECVYS